MQAGRRRRISIVTKIFSVFLAITALDISLIYILIGSGQIDLISRNGLLMAENSALRIAHELRSPMMLANLKDVSAGPLVQKLRAEGLPGLKSCGINRGDEKLAAPLMPQVVKALRLYESERRLFIADLNRTDFTANLFVPVATGEGVADTVLTCSLELASLRESFQRLMHLALVILAVTLLAQAVLALFVYRVIIRRLRSLEGASQKLAAGDFSGEYKEVGRADEIDNLAETFYQMKDALADKTRVLEDTLLRLEKANFDLEGDLILGEEIQRSILPEAGTGKTIEWVATYRPVGRVSGDFYDVFELPGGATGILQFDASGHGVPAALLTMMAKISFAEAVQKHATPALAMAHVNDELSLHLQKTGNFLTAFYAVISQEGKLTYCNAAHTQVLLLKENGMCELLDPTSLSVGFAPLGGADFHNGEATFAPGDRLLIYTDGVTETRDSQGVAFGLERLAKLAGEHAAKPLIEMHKTIETEWQSAVSPKAIEDDVTLLSIARI
ncbi:PP2C family protein-serine/threonine phosphatase [Turneriella parva]|uniref:Protein serine/threonine phosphatase with extracellular sensor n=1 Tax=Turneriella parva (strain ATCC BAA-1111 / DSM 21527 / NCTC 11395 / H) TaxID=869212 RepID=I4B6U0_TURPD|nr:SpoIIE family protein phosphatase [Turneriella parva]AFM12997.1 protein serine/threonine phosphatase with extracellular sensor [Turneriella parva DSM 21527]